MSEVGRPTDFWGFALFCFFHCGFTFLAFSQRTAESQLGEEPTSSEKRQYIHQKGNMRTRKQTSKPYKRLRCCKIC